MSSTNAAFIGLDVGTTAVKAVLVLADGSEIVEYQCEYSVISPHQNWYEQEPEAWWDGTKSVLARIVDWIRQCPDRIEVKALSVAGQMHSSVFLDKDNQVVRPAILWNDSRTSLQCNEITDRIGIDRLRDSVGNLVLEGFTAPKILWLLQNEPLNYERTRKIIMPKDYVRFRLTGQIATDPSDAAGTVLYDVKNSCWSKRVISQLGFDLDLFPTVIPSEEVAGVVCTEGFRDTLIPEGTPVICGGADNPMGAIGSGVVNPGSMQSSIGTSGTILAPTNTPYIEDDMRLHTFCHCIADTWYLMGTILSAGNSLKWLKSVISPSDSYDRMVTRAERVTPGSEGLVFLPYLSGERTPHNDPYARGAFVGLNLSHGADHLIRAVLEGVCFALRDSVELIEGLGVSCESLVAIGAGGQNRFWRKLQADIFDMPVYVTNRMGGPAYGAAMVAAVGAGIFDDSQEVIQEWIVPSDMVEPIRNNVLIYDDLYASFQGTYPSLKDTFTRLSQSQK